MTDNEIIKALKCCENDDCTNCPCYVGGFLQCTGIPYSELLDIIKRKNAEIERLKYLLEYEEGKYDKCAKQFYKEGVKDLAERLEKSLYKASPNPTFEDEIIAIVNDLANEMVGAE